MVSKEKIMMMQDLFGQISPNISLNSDGVSISGCNIIYAPAGQAGEYAPLATNPYSGCGHKCAYCYVPKVLRMDRATFDSGATERTLFIKKLVADAKKYQSAGITEQVMMSFTTDPYHPGDTRLTTAVIEQLIQHGLAFCTLTKGGSRALRDKHFFRPGRDAFASTLTSLDEKFSRKWEAGAALPDDRIKTLKAFYEAGIFTWVSLEPTIDTVASLEIIRRTHEFVNLYKIGRVNYIGMTNTTDWRSYTLDIVELCAKLGVKHYIKRDLQQYLPVGYYNPLRISQHN